MKKRFFCILFAVLLCASLCACGSTRMDNGRTDRTDMLPDTSPMVSPDMSDGIVDDQDGIIGNGGYNGADQGNDGREDTVIVSPSPENGMNGNPAATSAPTTAPSGSPNP